MSYTLKRLLTAETIGDSLSTVNNNYYNLDIWTTSIMFSADSVWSPLIDYYNFYKSEWNQIISLTKANSAKWLSMVTTVEANSAKWIEPITIYYPNFFPDPFRTNDIVTVTNFIRQAFPVYPGKGNYPGVYGTRLNQDPNLINTLDFIDSDQDGVDDRYQRFPGDNGTTELTVGPVYVENQMAIIYSLTYTEALNTISVNTQLRDFTVCATNPRNVCITCWNYYSGGGPCGWGNVHCPSYNNSCSQCSDVQCWYNNPPYVPIAAPPGWSYGQSAIAANVGMNFSERRESLNIIAIVYRIKNCQWEFERFITV